MSRKGKKLTGKQNHFVINDKYNFRGDGVSLVNWQLNWKSVWVGILLTISLHLLIDWAMFGTPFPCKTVQTFEDGSSIQSCEVRN